MFYNGYTTTHFVYNLMDTLLGSRLPQLHGGLYLDIITFTSSTLPVIDQR